MVNVNKLALTPEQNNELAQLKALREEIAVKERAIKAKGKGIQCKVGTTTKGMVGFTLNGLGVPKWFYKQQALALFSDTEEAKAMRKQVLDFIVAHTELTDKV